MHATLTARLRRSLNPGRPLFITKACLAALTAWLLAAGSARADGCFVFVWDKQTDINEPTQKAILLHDQGREELVLQVKYDGPAEEFGWLVPVPGLPQVSKGSMEGFYELSRLTQEHWPERHLVYQGMMSNGAGPAEPVKVIEIKTVGAYEVAVLASTKAASLTEWLAANHFVFPKDKQAVLDRYIQKGWYFVAARINPEGNGFALKSGTPQKAAIARATRKKLANGELHPLVLSFPAEKCVFPLAISAVNGKPSEVSLYVLSAEPLMSRVIFERKFAAYQREWTQWLQERPQREKARAESRQRTQALHSRGTQFQREENTDPADPPPAPEVMAQILPEGYWEEAYRESDDDYYGPRALVRSMEVDAKQIPGTVKELPRLAGKSWWLTKEVQTFTAAEMRDLEFEPAIPMLAEKLRAPDGPSPARELAQFGPRALPVVLKALQSADPAQHRLALVTLTDAGFSGRRAVSAARSEANKETADPRLTAALARLLTDADAHIRAKACEAAAAHWDAAFAPKLVDLLRDNDPEVRPMANHALQGHQEDLEAVQPMLRKLVEEDSPAVPYAISLVVRPGTPIPEAQLPRLLASTNLPVVSTAFSQLRRQEDLKPSQLEPLLTNSLPMARLMGLGALKRIGNKVAMERMVAMLHDPNEGMRWRVRSSLRQLSGQKLGANPAAWEQWWATNKATFTPQSPTQSRRRPQAFQSPR